MPVGIWVMRIADSVLLTCWPPAPCARMVSIRKSSLLMSTSTSSTSGSTATVAAEVWMRPCVSVSGTRCTRCTPDSNFSLAKAPRPCTSAMISLKPPMVPSLAEITSTFQPCKRGEALIHPEQVAGEQRGLVAAGAGADFQHHVALVHGVLGQQRDADLLRQFDAARLQRFALGLRHAAHLGVGRGIRHQRLDVGDLLARRRDRPSRRRSAD